MGTLFGDASQQNSELDFLAPPEGAPPAYVNEKHVACVLLLDTSASMANGNAIGLLNVALASFKSSLDLDKVAKGTVDVAILTFGGGVELVQNFTPVATMATPTLAAHGNTPMGQALNQAIDLIEARKEQYKTLGTPYWRPWIFAITDGMPTDDVTSAAARLKDCEAHKKLLGHGVGVADYDRDSLLSIFDPARCYELDGLDFSGLFQFLSDSMSALSNSTPNATSISVDLPESLRKIEMEI